MKGYQAIAFSVLAICLLLVFLVGSMLLAAVIHDWKNKKELKTIVFKTALELRKKEPILFTFDPRANATLLLRCKDAPNTHQASWPGVHVWDCFPYGDIDWDVEEGILTAHASGAVCRELVKITSLIKEGDCYPLTPGTHEEWQRRLDEKYAK